MRYATQMSDFRRRIQRQRNQVYVENYERRCTDPWTLLNGHYAHILEVVGFSRGAASPCHFFHEGLQTYILVHGDDLFIEDRRERRKHTPSLLQGAYERSKVVTLGPESSQSRTFSFLGRTLTSRQWRIEFEPDQQHVSRALKVLGLRALLGGK